MNKPVYFKIILALSICLFLPKSLLGFEIIAPNNEYKLSFSDELISFKKGDYNREVIKNKCNAKEWELAKYSILNKYKKPTRVPKVFEKYCYKLIKNNETFCDFFPLTLSFYEIGTKVEFLKFLSEDKSCERPLRKPASEKNLIDRIQDFVYSVDSIGKDRRNCNCESETKNLGQECFNDLCKKTKDSLTKKLIKLREVKQQEKSPSQQDKDMLKRFHDVFDANMKRRLESELRNYEKIKLSDFDSFDLNKLHWVERESIFVQEIVYSTHFGVNIKETEDKPVVSFTGKAKKLNSQTKRIIEKLVELGQMDIQRSFELSQTGIDSILIEEYGSVPKAEALSKFSKAVMENIFTYKKEAPILLKLGMYSDYKVEESLRKLLNGEALSDEDDGMIKQLYYKKQILNQFGEHSLRKNLINKINPILISQNFDSARAKQRWRSSIKQRKEKLKDLKSFTMECDKGTLFQSTIGYTDLVLEEAKKEIADTRRKVIDFVNNKYSKISSHSINEAIAKISFFYPPTFESKLRELDQQYREDNHARTEELVSMLYSNSSIYGGSTEEIIRSECPYWAEITSFGHTYTKTGGVTTNSLILGERGLNGVVQAHEMAHNIFHVLQEKPMSQQTIGIAKNQFACVSLHHPTGKSMDITFKDKKGKVLTSQLHFRSNEDFSDRVAFEIFGNKVNMGCHLAKITAKFLPLYDFPMWNSDIDDPHSSTMFRALEQASHSSEPLPETCSSFMEQNKITEFKNCFH